MIFSPPLHPATLLKRYKRFLADIELPNGELTTIHCPNTGAMTRCLVEGSECWYSISDNPKRKYPFTWELATAADGFLVGVNTGRANALVKEAIVQGVIDELQGYDSIQSEVKYGNENSRIDFLLQAKNQADCYVEVKSVTLSMGNGQGLFPDAISLRGAKHLRELMQMVEQGYRAVLLFCVQHAGISVVSPAHHIDANYAALLKQAVDYGVEVYAYGAQLSSQHIALDKPLSFTLEPKQ